MKLKGCGTTYENGEEVDALCELFNCYGDNCPNIKEVYVYASDFAVLNTAFWVHLWGYNAIKNAVLYVPPSLVGTYQTFAKNVKSVEANPNWVSATGVKLDKTAVTLGLGGTATLTAAVEPANASSKSLRFVTSDANIVNFGVDDNGNAITDVNSTTGKVTVVANKYVNGTATISIIGADGVMTFCQVTVSAAAAKSKAAPAKKK